MKTKFSEREHAAACNTLIKTARVYNEGLAGKYKERDYAHRPNIARIFIQTI